MSRYRKIDPRIWNDEKFRRLNDTGRYIFLFLLTHPGMTALGAMRATTAGLAAELSFSRKKFMGGFVRLLQEEVVAADDTAACLVVPNFLKYNAPEGPNSIIKAWPEALDLIPECSLKRELIRKCKSYLESLSEEFRNKLPDHIYQVFTVPSDMACRMPSNMPSPIQEQEPEPEPEQEKETVSPDSLCSITEKTIRSNDGNGATELTPAESFEVFYKAYPRKKSRGRAEKAWKKIKPTPDLLRTILDAIQQAKQSKEWQEETGKYILYPAAWLNAKGWEDEFSITNQIEPQRKEMPA